MPCVHIFSEFLIEPNHRQYHVTLFICGFLTNETKIYGDDFSFGEFVQQREILKKRRFCSVSFKKLVQSIALVVLYL